MTGWISAREAQQRLQAYRLDSPEVTLMHLALNGVSTRASEWRKDGDTLWEVIDDSTLRQPDGSTLRRVDKETMAKARKLGNGFWEAMRRSPEHVDWQLGRFSHSTMGLYSREGDCLVEPTERVFWTAMGVEFCWQDVVQALALKRQPARPDAPQRLVDEWLEELLRTLPDKAKRPGSRAIEVLFEDWYCAQANAEYCPYCLSRPQREQVVNAWPTDERKKPGRPPK